MCRSCWRLATGCDGEIVENGVLCVVPATQEEGQRVKESVFLDLKSCESLDVT